MFWELKQKSFVVKVGTIAAVYISLSNTEFQFLKCQLEKVLEQFRYNPAILGVSKPTPKDNEHVVA